MYHLPRLDVATDSYDPATTNIDIPLQDRSNETVEAKRARLVYSSRHRGILETDLLLSTFLKENIQSLGKKQLEELDTLMNENDWDIYYWMTQGKLPPKWVQEMSIWNDMVEHAKNKGRKILKMPEVGKTSA